MSRNLAAVAALALIACPHDAARPPHPKQPARGAVTITVIGTSDTHGALDRLPMLAGFVENIRAARAADGGAVVLVDAGDLFQGTLASNLTEGAPVIDAFNAMAYDAAAVGNHEFDFGPAGPSDTPKADDDDPRGALKERAAQAHFPLLAANLLDAASGARIKWKNMPASIIVEKAGVKIGIVGVTTESTPFTTMPVNFKGLAVAPPAQTIIDEAKALRAKGAQIVIVAAHLGGKCTKLDDPNDTSSCDPDEEIMKVVPAIPHGLVDVIVAAHTHQGMAQRINGIPVIESYNAGRAFGRVDLRVSASGIVTGAKIYPPKDMCAIGKDGNPVPIDECAPGEYEGKPVVSSQAIAEAIAPAMEKAKARRDELIGVELASAFPARYDEESAEGDLFTDLMLSIRKDADVAITNGGGLRADLPQGPLTYGALFTAMPFDNHFAIVGMQGKHLRKLIAGNLHTSSGILAIAGVTVKATCKKGVLEVALFDHKGKPIEDDRSLVVATNDFLASGGDGAIGRLALPDGAVDLTDVIIRDAMAAELKKRGGSISAKDFFDPKKPRLDFPGKRPVKCDAAK
ncbi:MAG TPA: 5'-nucleotidase C-terminal domain-containing protein [Kofleriaceae bacterium]|nr:5'-nucleotidase C-terminal domain-containing protein [Kofleriaceae bacterium]